MTREKEREGENEEDDDDEEEEGDDEETSSLCSLSPQINLPFDFHLSNPNFLVSPPPSPIPSPPSPLLPLLSPPLISTSPATREEENTSSTSIVSKTMMACFSNEEDWSL